MHSLIDPSFFLTNKTGAPHGGKLGQMNPLSSNSCNYVFNSFSSIELSVMKKYAMPLLEEISIESEYFPIAERLIRMLKFFNDIPDKWIPCNSIIREFIGGSCYEDA